MANVIYATKLGDYEAVEDKYDEGEIGVGILKDAGFDHIEAPTLKELLEKVAKHYYISEKAIFKNIVRRKDCDPEEGSVVFEMCWTEDIEGNTIDWDRDIAEIEGWKRGQNRFWSCRMLLVVHKYTAEDIDDSEVTALGISLDY